MIAYVPLLQKGGKALWLHAYQSLGVVYGDLGTLIVQPLPNLYGCLSLLHGRLSSSACNKD